MSSVAPETGLALIPETQRPPRLIFGETEMAALTRAFPWSSTGLGPIESWPELLLTTVNTMLASRHPITLWWGPELIQFYNDGFRSTIGHEKHPHALGQPGREYWSEVWPIVGREIEATMTRGEASWHENQLVPIYRDGKLEDVYWTYGYSPVRDSAGTICGTLVICSETTDSVLANRRLQQESERFAAAFQQAPAFFATLGGPDHVFEMANARYIDLIGGRPILGKPVREAVPEAESQGFLALLDSVYHTGVAFTGEAMPLRLARNSSPSLELRYVDFVYEPRREADGSISGIIVLGVDVTERKQAEQALLQSEKLAAVGRLASSIAHEINNPLAAITNLLYLARRSAVSASTQDYLDEAEVQLRRVAAIVNQTLRFHRQASAPVETTLEQLTRDTLSLFQGRLLNAHVDVEQRHSPQPAVTCLDGEIRQVVGNLVGNALDAMVANGGRLLLRTRAARDRATGLRGVRLTVADTGGGIPPALLPRIFEAFFTTKGENGTGLGLWITHEIVERHQGRVSVRSAAGRGTIFVVWLPCDTKKAPGAQPPEQTNG